MRAAMMRIRKVATLTEALETAMFLLGCMSFFFIVFFSLSSLSLILSNLREKERREKAK